MNGRASWGGRESGGALVKEVNRKSPGALDGKQGKRYLHIADLKARAQAELDVDINQPIRNLLRKAEDARKVANSCVEFKRIDMAYTQYLVASDLVVNIIPHHKDYPEICANRGDSYSQLYKSLIKSINAQQGMFEEIKQMIVDDNKKSSIQPSKNSSASGSASTGVSSVPAPYPNGQGLQIPTTPPLSPDGLYDSNRLEDGSDLQLNSSEESPGIKPIAGGKPRTPQSQSSSDMTASGDLLAQRFARLREPTSTTNPSANARVLPYPDDGQNARESVSISFPPSLRPGNSPLPSTTSQQRPLGPRKMPNSSSGPMRPPKIPLDDTYPTLPRPPSPAYNPTGISSDLAPLDSETREGSDGTMNNFAPTVPVLMARAPSRSSYSSSTSGPYASSTTSLPYASSFSRGSTERLVDSRSPTPKPMDVSKDQGISPTKLLDYLKKYRVLLIDVRDRPDFDSGHIFHRSILCVEPLDLKTGMSAEDLEERLVVSPESESKLFERRNEFDLVVYYDQDTETTDHLKGSPADNDAPMLRALYDTLYEFNYYRPLRRPPVMLLGGLEAWVDVFGPQSLATSNTAALIGSTQQQHRARREGRTVSRVPLGSSNSSLEVRRRRLREYRPLNADEERQWLEQAKHEGVAAPDYRRISVNYDNREELIDEEAEPELVRSYDDFLRRFPEVSAVQQSMMVPSNRQYVPSYEPPPMLPHEPLRPPPAVPRTRSSGVLPRVQSHTLPPSRQKSAFRPPLYSSVSTFQRLRLPRTGLVNFSVTCYMNATIQCLNATLKLTSFFLEDRWNDFVQPNWKGSNGIMPKIYANLIRNLWKEDCQAIRPTTFRRFCGRLNHEWGIDRQQDAKEFFDFLVDCLHEDLNISWNRTPLNPLTTKQEMHRESMPMQLVSQIEWDRYTHRENSFISDIFAGQHASRLRCTTCNCTSTTYEAFYSISVEIPRSGRGDIYGCLRSYTKEEMLSGDEVWKCPNCRCERVATKKIILTRAPQFLVIHFKRFSASKTESARKVHTPIDFPLYGLNLDQFMLEPPNPQLAQEIIKRNSATGADTNKTAAATTGPFSYDAYAVMRHIGQSGNGGHYIALVKDASRNCWRKFDDERPSDIDPRALRPDQRLQNEQAYIIFYERTAAR